MTRLIRNVAVAALLVGLGGCVGPSQSLNIAPPRLAASAQSVIADTPSLPTGATMIAEATGVSCKNKMWDPGATESAALAQLKVQAATMGGTGVAGVVYRSEGTTISANCWQAVYATGTVYR